MKRVDCVMAVALERLDVPIVTVAIPDLSAGTPAGNLQMCVMCRAQSEPEWLSLPGAGSYCARVMREARSLSVSSTRLDRLSRASDLLRAEEAFAYYGTPIPALTGGAIGTFAALSSPARFWSQDKQGIAADLARQIGFKLAPPNMRATYACVT